MFKKSIVLVELIFTIVIISIVSIFTMTFLYSLYDKLSNEYTNEIDKLQNSSTNIFLGKIFQNALNINVSANSISFYKEDNTLFDLGYYSRFVDLNNSLTTKNSIYSPNTKAHELIDYHISFDDTNFYSIKDNSYANQINLDDTNTKEIKEHYKIISIGNIIKCERDKLYYNENILLENISQCSFSTSSKTININLIKNDIPISWKFKL